METAEIITVAMATLVIAPFIFLFVDGFMSSAKVESNKNDAMKSFLTLVGKTYYPINRFGAWLRRLLQGLKRA